MSTRLTRVELEAIAYALNAQVWGIIDGIEEGTEEYERIARASETALEKIDRRLASR